MNDQKVNWYLNMKKPAIIVSAKLIPVAMGMVKENEADDKALNMTSAEIKIREKARIT